MDKPLFNRWLNNPIYFQCGAFGLLIFSILLNNIILQNDDTFYILYIFTAISFGIGFNSKSNWLLFLFTIIVVTYRYPLIPQSDSSIVIYLVHLSTYFLITIISARLMKLVQKVKKDQLELTKALANALDSRDPYTLQHSENVAMYSVLIAEKLNLPKNLCEIIRKGSLLHDIGKIGIPEHVLLKSGKLTTEEYEVIKKHPTIGYEMIKHIGDFDQNGILDIVLYHHERMDGKGYPKGLKGEEIPLLARIVAVADTFDAMTSKRIYRDKLDLEFTLNEIQKCKRTQFDPEIVDAFLSLFK